MEFKTKRLYIRPLTIKDKESIFEYRSDSETNKFQGWIPQKIEDLAKTRSEYRKNGIWDKADIVRKQISEMGYVVEDTPNGKYKVKRKL